MLAYLPWHRTRDNVCDEAYEEGSLMGFREPLAMTAPEGFRSSATFRVRACPSSIRGPAPTSAGTCSTAPSHSTISRRPPSRADADNRTARGPELPAALVVTIIPTKVNLRLVDCLGAAELREIQPGPAQSRLSSAAKSAKPGYPRSRFVSYPCGEAKKGKR